MDAVAVRVARVLRALCLSLVGVIQARRGLRGGWREEDKHDENDERQDAAGPDHGKTIWTRPRGADEQKLKASMAVCETSLLDPQQRPPNRR